MKRGRKFFNGFVGHSRPFFKRRRRRGWRRRRGRRKRRWRKRRRRRRRWRKRRMGKDEKEEGEEKETAIGRGERIKRKVTELERRRRKK